jgi:[protein-PII] uridylyltransferase
VFLVEQHLTMSHVAQKQDMSDPDVITAFAQLVKDERHLTALYLLTVADIRGTSPKVWNAWKGKLLEDLYRMTLRVLGGEAPRPTANSRTPAGSHQDPAPVRPAGRRPRAAVEAARRGLLPAPRRLRHRLADALLYDKVDTGVPVVRCRLAPIGEGVQVAVYTPDQPDLFARICSYFDARASASSTPRSTPPATATRWTPS